MVKKRISQESKSTENHPALSLAPAEILSSSVPIKITSTGNPPPRGVPPDGDFDPDVPTLDELAMGSVDGDDDDNSSSHLGDHQEFFIPVHGFVRFTPCEIQIIDHPAFQRLGKIYQLGQTHLVYRGATHKRLEHVLGTVHVAQKMVNAVEGNRRQFLYKHLDQKTECPFDKPLTEREQRFVRLAALLHDIGHLPAGHTFEDELCLLEAHDADKRLHLVLGKEDWIPGEKVTSLETLINENYSRFLPRTATVTPVDILFKIISKSATDLSDCCEIRISICRDIVGNTICADLLDYLHRDWHHVGRPQYFEKRLFQYMQIRIDNCDKKAKFVISYGQRSRPKRDSISTVLALLESRYNLFEAVLFHPTKCAAAAMLERAVGELHAALPEKEKDSWLDNLENRLLGYSDDEFLSSFLNEAIQLACAPAANLFRSLVKRRIHKSLCLLVKEEIPTDVSRLLQYRFIGDPEILEGQDHRNAAKERRAAANRRRNSLVQFEDDLGLPQGTLTIYCPPPRMSSKIAEVKMIRDDGIMTLEDWDKPANGKLAGGHCAAQLERFETLWRVEVFAPAQYLNDQGEDHRELLQKTVRTFLLGIADSGATLQRTAASLANEWASQKGPFHGHKVVMQEAARGDIPKYEMGAPTLKSLLGIE